MKTLKTIICTVLEFIFLAFQFGDFSQNPMATAKHKMTMNYERKINSFYENLYK